MIGGKIEDGETALIAAIKECHEELGSDAIFAVKYNGKLSDKLTLSDEIELIRTIVT